MSFVEKYGPWALIAGASEGTGACFARKLAARGLNLVMLARREPPLAALAAEIEAEFGVQCVTASIDLSQDGASAKVIEAVDGREIGLFINNAGSDYNNANFLEQTLAGWEALAQLDVMNVLRNTYYFAGKMRARRRGGIILVGSGACYGGLSGKAVYSAVKSFDLCLGEALWAELRHDGVDVLNLILGQTDTPAHRQILAELGLPVPANLASADAVAELGLERLPHGPICNFGSADDEPGVAPNSPAHRRARILAVEKASQVYTKKN